MKNELLDFAKNNPRFVTEEIEIITNSETFSEHTLEEIILNYLDNKTVEELVKRFRFINNADIKL